MAEMEVLLAVTLRHKDWACIVENLDVQRQARKHTT